MTLASSDSVADFDQPVTITAFIRQASPTSTIPTGTMYFFDGLNFLGPATGVTVVNGIATVTTPLTTPAITALTVGTHSAITAAYFPDPTSNDTFAPSGLSSPLTETIQPAIGTSVTVSSSAPNSVAGQPVTFTATINLSAPTGVTPTGTVYFFDGLNFLGSSSGETVGTNGTATVTTSTLSAGLHSSITAAYFPDATSANEFGSSGLSAPFTENILATAGSTDPSDPTTVVLKASPLTATVGQAVTFTAFIVPSIPTNAIPTGAVQIFDGNMGGMIGPSTGVLLTNGMATISTSVLTAGTHILLANYVPDATSAGKFEQSGLNLNAPIVEAINPPSGVGFGPAEVQNQAMAFVRTSTVTLGLDKFVSLTAIVSPVMPDALSPSGGTEYFFDGLALIGTATVNNGVATMNAALSSLDVGMNFITTAYTPEPDSLFISSKLSQSFQLTVNPF